MSTPIYQLPTDPHIRLPYTYRIGWTKFGLSYYGVRYAKGCHPKELWVTYFTSSRLVQEKRKEIGEPDIIEIRRTFRTPDDAVAWEQKVLDRLRVCFKDCWLNRAQSGGKVLGSGPAHNHYGIPKSEETKRKMSIAGKRYFQEHPEARIKLSQTMKNSKKFQDAAAIRGARRRGSGHPLYGSRPEDNPRALIWEFTSPDGKTTRVVGRFRYFCEENGLSTDTLIKAIRLNKWPERGCCAGWRVKKIIP